MFLEIMSAKTRRNRKLPAATHTKASELSHKSGVRRPEGSELILYINDITTLHHAALRPGYVDVVLML